MLVDLVPRKKIVCFTGHRPQHLGGFGDTPVSRWIKKRLLDSVHWASREGFELFISGGALGVDQWATEAVLHARDKENLPVRLVIVVPFTGYDRKWRPETRRHYKVLRDLADEVVILEQATDTGREYSLAAAALHARDRWMVDHSSLCIAVHMKERQHGGTWYTIDYARRSGVRVIRIDPTEVLAAGGT